MRVVKSRLKQRRLRRFRNESTVWDKQTEEGREFQIDGAAIVNERKPRPINVRNAGDVFWRWRTSATVPDDRSGNAETSFAEFRGCSRYGQISMFCRTETGSAREIRRRYADVQGICGTGTAACKECNFKLFAAAATASERPPLQSAVHFI